MIIKSDFEIVEVADECLAVPVGDEAVSFNGVVAMNEASAYLLKNAKKEFSKSDLVNMLLQEYDVEKDIAEADVDTFIKKLCDIGLVEAM